MRFPNLLTALVLMVSASHATAQYDGWKHTGALFLNTTPDGANLPANSVVEGVP